MYKDVEIFVGSVIAPSKKNNYEACARRQVNSNYEICTRIQMNSNYEWSLHNKLSEVPNCSKKFGPVFYLFSSFAKIWHLDTVSDLLVLGWLLVGMSWRLWLYNAFGSKLLRKIKEKWSLIKQLNSLQGGIWSPRWLFLAIRVRLL